MRSGAKPGIKLDLLDVIIRRGLAVMICLQEFVGIRLEKSLVCVYERNTRRSRKREFCRAIFPFDHRARKLPCIGSQRKVDPRIGNAPNLLALAPKASRTNHAMG